MGTAIDTSSSTEINDDTGLVPRAVDDIFRRCSEAEKQAGGKNHIRFEVSASFVELYNEVSPLRYVLGRSGHQSLMTTFLLTLPNLPLLSLHE